MRSLDPKENAVVKIIRETAIATNDRAGDGTTGALIMLQAIIGEVARRSVFNGRKIELELKGALVEVQEQLKNMATPIETQEELRKVARISIDDEKIANFMINHANTPEDLILYWDYDAPGIPNEPRDASAAAIMASALLELSTYSNDHSNLYFDKAEKILQNLASDTYLASPGTNNNFILKHSTGNKPGDSEIDVPLIYGDYYFIEALLRYKELKEKKF